MASQLAINNTRPSVRDYVAKETLNKIEEENSYEISLSAKAVKEKASEIKAVLSKFPGDKIVYLKVGEKKIKTSYKVADADALKSEINKVLG
jgi:chaperonin cofactor prefoldin